MYINNTAANVYYYTLTLYLSKGMAVEEAAQHAATAAAHAKTTLQELLGAPVDTGMVPQRNDNS